MKKIYSAASRWLKKNWLAVLIFFLTSLFIIIKSFTTANCLAFDENDDRNHTFVNLFASREIMKAGALPQINFYNNFGTPILGDAITYPFAIQALTYFFFADPFAMTLNRFIICFLTLLVLYEFFKDYFDRKISCVITFFVFFAPGFFWHFAHHNYQTSLLFTGLILLLVSKRNKEWISDRLFLPLTFLASVLLVLSTSINLVVIIIPFVILSSFFLSRKPWRLMILTAIGIFAALISTAPQTLSFIKDFSESYRLESSYISGTAYEHYSLLKVLDGALTQARTGGGHIDTALYYSLLVLLAIGFGTYFSYKNDYKQKFNLIVFMGIIPTIAIFSLLSFPKIWDAIPFLRAMDITRVWWISNIFLALALGNFISKLFNLEITRKQALILLIASIISALFIFSGVTSCGLHFTTACKHVAAIEIIYKVNLIICPLLFLFYLLLRNRSRKNIIAIRTIFIVIFALAIWPTPYRILALGIEQPPCSGSHFFAPKDNAGFKPKEFLELMQPFSRLASDQPSSRGYDLTAIFGNILGSNGRSIIMHKDFTDYLLDNKLVQIDDRLGSYHFEKPWQPRKMESLGIRYLITAEKSDELSRNSWRIIDEKDGLFLYESQSRPTPFYLKFSHPEKIEYLREYEFTGNTAIIKLSPQKESSLFVATFIDRPGWRASIDGKETDILKSDEGFVTLPIKQGATKILIYYEPFGWGDIIFWGLGGAILIFSVLMKLSSRRKDRIRDLKKNSF